MPPKKREAAGANGKAPKSKRQKKKKDEFDDSDSDVGVDEANNGNGPQVVEDTGPAVDITLEAPMISGELLLCGMMNWDMTGRKSLPKGANSKGPNLWKPNRLADKGQVFSCGENKMGQLGIGTSVAHVASPQRIAYRGPPVRTFACGAEFSMMADIRGNLYSFGCPEYGQLVAVWIEKSRDGRVTPIVDVEVVVDSKKRVFSWGFGAYGRLGHAENKDEMVPRLIKSFEGLNRGASTVKAGSSFSFAVTETGEATMYPKPVMDLSGWRIRSVGCGKSSVVVAADDSVVAWGPSPAYGELGFGEGCKSSTTAKEVKNLEGLYIHTVSCGQSHTLMLARVDTEEEKASLNKLPLYTPG
ncbi:RCC2-like protein [Mya arenaria]|uniref:RCC2-like protein n=1 Tax=Mya arenaria TaxID=6604 RepID=A0ABY7EYX0_MYAAR|nr:RCC2-like protein [Mya arenaria]